MAPSSRQEESEELEASWKEATKRSLMLVYIHLAHHKHRGLALKSGVELRKQG
jgi:hypothetical protein